MFVGSINQDIRAVLAELSPRWKGRPIYIGCSGSFAVERLLTTLGHTDLNGNDFGLYPVVVGSHLSGQDCDVRLKPEAGLDWLPADALTPGPTRIATLLLLQEYVKFLGRGEAYHRRMATAYETAWPDLHAKTLAKVTTALDGVRLRSFFAGDPLDFIRQAPDDVVAMAFPAKASPLEPKFDELFEWNRPEHLKLTEPHVTSLLDAVMEKADWLRVSPTELPALKDQCVGCFQNSVRGDPLYAYAGSGTGPRTSTAAQTIEAIPVGRLEGEVDGPLRLVRLSLGQLNLLRSEYLGVGIAPASAQINVGVLVGDKLIGATGFGMPQYSGGWCDAYMMADLAIRPTVYKKLAKLVLAAVLSHEMKAVLEQGFNHRVRTIGTTAFTQKNVSMKYRGIFDIYSRKEGVLNYRADAGRWSLADGLAWWQQSHAQRA